MSDILIPTEPEAKVYVKEVDGSVREVSSHGDRFTALRHANRLNFVRGHRTGALYYIEEVN